MLLEPTSDQAFFRETTARFLAAHAPVDALRRLRTDPTGFDREHWRHGAELGWTSLLVSEEHGGGSISGRGLVDLTLIAHEIGWHAAPGPFVPTNVVAAALSDTGSQLDVLAALLEGTAIATWCHAEPPPAAFGDVHLSVRVDGDELVLDGVKRPVESAAAAEHLLVTGTTAEGLSQVLVPSDAPGITIVPLHTVDQTRRFATVRFDDVRVPASAAVGAIGDAAAQIERQLQLGLVLLTAEAVGALQHAFDLTVEWAFDRYSFGRPLASYQALKHRFADMKSWLEASHAISDAAAAAVQEGAPEAAELVSAAKSFIGEYGAELLHDCVQMHGGIGVTYEHDLHLFLRRGVLDQALLGTPADHRQRIADLMLSNGQAA